MPLLFQLIIFSFFFAFLLNTSAADPSQEYCDAKGWSLWQGNCYKIFTAPNSMIFSEAEQICQAWGAHAASVHSDDENRFIAEVARENFQALRASQNLPNFDVTTSFDPIQGGLYLGYRRVKEPGASKNYKCFNMDGTPMDYADVPQWREANDNKLPILGYPWNGPNPASGCCAEPSKLVPEDCVELLDWPGYYGTWNDIPCSLFTVSGVVCKKPSKCK